MVYNKLNGLSQYLKCIQIFSVFLISILLSCTDGQNLVYTRPAKQIGTYQNNQWLNASFAVDGNNNTYSLADSGDDSIPAWWSVDMQYDYVVQKIALFAPNNVDSIFLQTFSVTVKTSAGVLQQCYSFTSPNEPSPFTAFIFQCSSELEGREIIITRNGGNQLRKLGLAEVLVWGELFLTDRALHRSTKQNGKYLSYESSYAVDGSSSSCAFADGVGGTNAWWQVDLANVYRILAVWITVGSADNMDKYFQDVTITVDNSDTTTSTQVCFIYNNGSSITAGVQLKLDCTKDRVHQGRYVTIRRNGGGVQPRNLAMCDVQVMGGKLLQPPGSTIAPTAVSTSISASTTVPTNPSPTTPSSTTTSSTTTTVTTTTTTSQRNPQAPSTTTTPPPTTTSPSTTARLTNPGDYSTTTNNVTGVNNGSPGGLSGGAIAGIVIGSILGAAVLAALIVLAVVYCRKRKFRQTSPQKEQRMSALQRVLMPDALSDAGRNLTSSYRTDTKSSGSRFSRFKPRRNLSDFIRMPKFQNSSPSASEVDSEAHRLPRPPVTSRTTNEYSQPILKSELAHYVQTQLNRPDKFKEEFKTIPDKELEKAATGKLKSNTDKNRFGNIIPYDRTLVPLAEESDPGDNYINASYIKGYPNVERKYIATQGPKEKTVNSFWKMIWQQNVDLIVMITQVHESGKYWPTDVRDKSKEFGRYKVVMEIEDKFCDYTYREFKVSNKGKAHDPVRRIRHMHFQSWYDKSAPDLRYPLINFLKRINSLDSGRSPLVVHCSAGIGRTGTYICLDYLLKQLKAEGKVSVYSCVLELRHQRMNMVQTVDQYQFVYQSLADIIAIGQEGTAIPIDSIKNEYKKLGSSGQLENQFEVLQQMKEENLDCRRSMGTQRENIKKNRDKTVVAYDDCRPHLNVTYNNSESNYINAIYVNSYRAKDAYTLTQCPLPGTVSDFWSLVWDQRIRTIVLLDEIDGSDPTVPVYWPTNSSTTVSHGLIDISLCSTFTEANIIQIYELSLNNSKEHDGELKVRLYQLCNAWPSHNSLPSTPASLLQLMSYVRIWHHKIQSEPNNGAANEGKTIIQCIDGYTRCGLMAAGMCLVERMRMEKEVDVFLSARHVTCNRPECINNQDQYNFLYKLAEAAASNANTTQEYYNENGS